MLKTKQIKKTKLKIQYQRLQNGQADQNADQDTNQLCHNNINSIYALINKFKVAKKISHPIYMMAQSLEQQFLTTEQIEHYSMEQTHQLKVKAYQTLTRKRRDEKIEQLRKEIALYSNEGKNAQNGQLKIGFLYSDPINNKDPVSYFDEITKVIKEIDKKEKKVIIQSLPATKKNLFKMLGQYKVDMLHVSCHGHSGGEQISWEDENFKQKSIKPQQFLQWVNSSLGNRKLMSLIIMACHSSRFIGIQPGKEPAKIKASMVVAFDERFEIQNTAAQLFSASIYSNFISQPQQPQTRTYLPEEQLTNKQCFDRAIRNLTQYYYFCPCHPARKGVPQYQKQYAPNAQSKNRKCNNNCTRSSSDKFTRKGSNVYTYQNPQYPGYAKRTNSIQKYSEYNRIIFQHFSVELTNSICEYLSIPKDRSEYYYFYCCCRGLEHKQPQDIAQSRDLFKYHLNYQENVPIIKNEKIKEQDNDQKEYLKAIDISKPFYRKPASFQLLCSNLSANSIRFVVGPFDSGKAKMILKALMYLDRRKQKMFEDIVYLNMRLLNIKSDYEDSIDSLIEFRARCNFKRNGKYHYINSMDNLSNNFVIFDKCSQMINQNPQAFGELVEGMQQKARSMKIIYLTDTPLKWWQKYDSMNQYEHKIHEKQSEFFDFIRYETSSVTNFLHKYQRKNIEIQFSYCDFKTANFTKCAHYKSKTQQYQSEIQREIAARFEQYVEAARKSEVAYLRQLMQPLVVDSSQQNKVRAKVNMKKINLAVKSIFEHCQNNEQFKKEVANLIEQLGQNAAMSRHYRPLKAFEVHPMNCDLKIQQSGTFDNLLTNIRLLCKLIPCIRKAKIVEYQKLYEILTNVPKAAIYLARRDGKYDVKKDNILIKEVVGKAIACLELLKDGAHEKYYKGLGILTNPLVHFVKETYVQNNYEIQRVLQHIKHMSSVFMAQLLKHPSAPQQIQLAKQTLKLQIMYYQVTLKKYSLNKLKNKQDTRNLKEALSEFWKQTPTRDPNQRFYHMYCQLKTMEQIVRINKKAMKQPKIRELIEQSKRIEDQQQQNMLIQTIKAIEQLGNYKRKAIIASDISINQKISFTLLVTQSVNSISNILTSQLQMSVDCHVDYLNEHTLKSTQYRDIMAVFVEASIDQGVYRCSMYQKKDDIMELTHMPLDKLFDCLNTKILLIFINGSLNFEDISNRNKPIVVTICFNCSDVVSSNYEMMLFLKYFFQFSCRMSECQVSDIIQSCQQMMRLCHDSSMSCVTQEQNKKIEIAYRESIKFGITDEELSTRIKEDEMLKRVVQVEHEKVEQVDYMPMILVSRISRGKSKESHIEQNKDEKIDSDSVYEEEGINMSEGHQSGDDHGEDNGESAQSAVNQCPSSQNGEVEDGDDQSQDSAAHQGFQIGVDSQEGTRLASIVNNIGQIQNTFGAMTLGSVVTMHEGTQSITCGVKQNQKLVSIQTQTIALQTQNLMVQFPDQEHQILRQPYSQSQGNSHRSLIRSEIQKINLDRHFAAHEIYASPSIQSLKNEPMYSTRSRNKAQSTSRTMRNPIVSLRWAIQMYQQYKQKQLMKNHIVPDKFLRQPRTKK